MKYSRKALAILLCAGLAASALAGCGKSNSGTSENAGDGKTGETVKLIWFTEQMDDVQHARWMKYVVTPFNEANPGYEVEISATADYEQVLKVQMAAKNGPDICNMGGPTITSEYVKGDKVLDLTNYVTESGLDQVIFQWALDSCKVDGKIYSIPNSYEALMLWYNIDMFEENGWTAPTNYEELKSLCNAIQEKNLIPIAFGTSDFKAINEQFVSVAFADYAGRDNVVKALNGEMKWTDPIFQDSIDCLNTMWQNGWINDKKSHAISDEDSNALFYSQQAAMRMTGTWQLGTYANQIKDFKYDAVPFPSLREGVPPTLPLGAGGVIAINANTKYPDVCWKFIQSMFDNKELHAQAVAEGAQTLPMDIPEELYPDTMNPVDKTIIGMLEETQKDLSAAGHVMWTYWPAETRQYMMDNIEKIYLGELTSKEYLEKTQEIFDKELADGKVPVVS